MRTETEIRKKLNQVIEEIALWDKENRKNKRHDWHRRFELEGMKIALRYVLEDIERLVL